MLEEAGTTPVLSHYTDYSKEAEEIPKPAEGRVGVEPSTIATTPS